jgi:hypothetical protein
MFYYTLWGGDLAGLLSDAELYTWGAHNTASMLRSNYEESIYNIPVLVQSGIDRSFLIKDMGRHKSADEINTLIRLSKELQ